MKKQQGFTLIELMIVVAIIAILAAIALPAYSDYTKKAKVSEVLLAASSLRTGVSEYVASNGSLPPATWESGTGAVTQYVSSVTWDGSRIAAVAQGISSDVNGQNITLTPGTLDTANNVIPSWACGGSIPAKFRPGSCQGAASTN